MANTFPLIATGFLPHDEITQKLNQSNNIICKLCGIPLTDPQQVKDHFKSEHPEDSIQRDIAIFLIENPFHRSNPYSYTHAPKEKNFECDLCGKKLSTELRLQNHKRAKHDFVDENFPAILDPPEDLSPKELSTLISQPEGQICSSCGKNCLNIHSLNRHIARKHGIITESLGPKSEFCDICGKQLKNWRGVKRHKWDKHPETHGQFSAIPKESDPRTCPFCHKYLNSVRGKVSHLATCEMRPAEYKTITNTTCEYCLKICQNKRGLIKHLSCCSKNPNLTTKKSLFKKKSKPDSSTISDEPIPEPELKLESKTESKMAKTTPTNLDSKLAQAFEKSSKRTNNTYSGFKNDLSEENAGPKKICTTVHLFPAQLIGIEQLIEEGWYTDRSELIRAAVTDYLKLFGVINPTMRD